MAENLSINAGSKEEKYRELTPTVIRINKYGNGFHSQSCESFRRIKADFQFLLGRLLSGERR